MPEIAIESHSLSEGTHDALREEEGGFGDEFASESGGHEFVGSADDMVKIKEEVDRLSNEAKEVAESSSGDLNLDSVSAVRDALSDPNTSLTLDEISRAKRVVESARQLRERVKKLNESNRRTQERVQNVKEGMGESKLTTEQSKIVDSMEQLAAQDASNEFSTETRTNLFEDKGYSDHFNNFIDIMDHTVEHAPEFRQAVMEQFLDGEHTFDAKTIENIDRAIKSLKESGITIDREKIINKKKTMQQNIDNIRQAYDRASSEKIEDIKQAFKDLGIDGIDVDSIANIDDIIDKFKEKLAENGLDNVSEKAEDQIETEMGEDEEGGKKNKWKDMPLKEKIAAILGIGLLIAGILAGIGYASWVLNFNATHVGCKVRSNVPLHLKSGDQSGFEAWLNQVQGKNETLFQYNILDFADQKFRSYLMRNPRHCGCSQLQITNVNDMIRWWPGNQENSTVMNSLANRAGTEPTTLLEDGYKGLFKGEAVPTHEYKPWTQYVKDSTSSFRKLESWGKGIGTTEKITQPGFSTMKGWRGSNNNSSCSTGIRVFENITTADKYAYPTGGQLNQKTFCKPVKMKDSDGTEKYFGRFLCGFSDSKNSIENLLTNRNETHQNICGNRMYISPNYVYSRAAQADVDAVPGIDKAWNPGALPAPPCMNVILDGGKTVIVEYTVKQNSLFDTFSRTDWTKGDCGTDLGTGKKSSCECKKQSILGGFLALLGWKCSDQIIWIILGVIGGLILLPFIVMIIVKIVKSIKGKSKGTATVTPAVNGSPGPQGPQPPSTST